MWVGPSGERPLLPKDEGTGTMISTFICREHGLLRETCVEILAKVNAQHSGQQYTNQDAAIELLGSADTTNIWQVSVSCFLPVWREPRRLVGIQFHGAPI
jgi:hypothetical protein